MSYFEDISKYSGDLSAQRDNFQSLIGRTKERLSAENQAKFDDITQRFEMIGGAVSASAMGFHGFAKAVGDKGGKLSMDEQLSKLKAKTLEENPEFSDFLSDARGRVGNFSNDFSSKIGKGPIQMGEIGDIYEGEGPVQLTAMERRPMGVEQTAEVGNKAFDSTALDADGSSAQNAYNQARAQLLDPSLRPDAPDSSITPRGNRLVGDGDRVKAADIYESDGRLAYPGPKQMMPRGNIGSSVANAGAKDSSLVGASLHPEVDGAGQLLHNKPTKGLTLNAPTQTTSSADSSIGFHNIEELRSVNTSLRPTPGGIETGRVRPNFDPITGARAKPMPGGVPDLNPEPTLAELQANSKQIKGNLAKIDANMARAEGIGTQDALGSINNPYVALPPGQEQGSGPEPKADPDAILPARPDQTTANPEGKAAPDKIKPVDVDNNTDTADGEPKFENEKPTTEEGDLKFANEGGLLGEGEDITQSAESAALGDTRALAQSKNTIGAFVEGLGAEEGAATGIEAAAAAGGAMEMASGAGEVIGAGILIAGVLHDVLQKPEAVATNLPKVGKIGFDPNAIGGSISGGGSGIA